MLIRTTCKAVNWFSNIARVKYSIVASAFIKLVKSVHNHADITPTNSRAKWENYRKAWNYIKKDFDQETARNIPQ